ncbi:MAG: class I SAM-dependent methyltransferase [Rhodocyclaceae bacterium]|nr:class I SAM-dependent methyltransferase [Rhodocyclaceae bacterium]
MISDKPSPGSQPWPADELEDVETCPYCDARQRSLAFHNVEDWTFGCAPGKWDYWRCDSCGALYLNPRPTAASIGKAYTRYYTHADSAGTSLKERIKTALRHTCYAAWYEIPLRPRLPWPRAFLPLLAPLRRRMAEPFLLQALNRLPRGRLMDIGCGNGGNLSAARQLGWVVQGIEIDPRAAETARAKGLDILVGDYRRLAEFEGHFDCVICSHVIEHVHAPRDLLHALHAALKPGGFALISLPNADSAMLEVVGENWRGLEAPRHLAIPTWRYMVELTASMGFVLDAAPVSPWVTLRESLAIAQGRGIVDLPARAMAAVRAQGEIYQERTDFINLVLRKT